MNGIKKLLVLALLFVSSLAYASKAGSLSVFAFYNGKPLSGIEILVDSKESYKTDSDGSLQIFLEVGEHKIEIFAKDADGNSLGYLKKPVTIKNEKDTLVTTTFTNNGKNFIDVDTPLDGFEEDTVVTTTGILNGVVLTSDKAKPIANARIFVKGTSTDARTDENGKFSIEIPSDVEVSISVVHSEYSAQTINNLLVKKDETISTKVELTPAAMELEEFIILAPKVTGSIASIMAEEKQATSISNILGSEEMSKKGDSDAASALKRVTGVTIIGGKDIYVRGLGDRYSNIEMNSMPLPSPDPTKRSVPLDIFPSGVIKSMKVQKSGTADIPTSFGGGYVDIRTKDKSKEDYVKVSLELKANSNTGKSVGSYTGSGSDFLGFDDGYRDVPSEIINASKLHVGEVIPSWSEEQELAYTKDIVDRKLTTTKENLPINFSAGVEIAQNYEPKDAHKISLFANYKYKQDHKYRSEEYNKYDYDKASDSLKSDPTQYGTNNISVSQYEHAGIFNIGYNFADIFNVKYTKLFTHTGESVTRISDGIAGSNDTDMTRYNLNWEERTLNVDQISGNFDYQLFDRESNFRFGVENAVASLYQPGNYKYGYNNNTGDDGTVYGDPFLDRGAANIFINMASDDELNALYLKNKFNFELFNEGEFIDIGYATSSKDKTYEYNKYEIIDSFRRDSQRKELLNKDIDTIYDTFVRAEDSEHPDSFKTTVNSLPEDQYDATVTDSSIYLITMLKPTKEIDFLFGARYVDFEQTVYTYTYGDNNNNPIFKEPNSLAINKAYPSMSLKYKLDKDNHFDFAYSQTYIVPDLREFTDSTYFHPYEVADVVGNPDLVSTEISNYDLKFSHYFSDTESLKFGLFYKYLDKPIEDNVLASSSLPRYSFHNADYADLYGFEIDGRKELSFIDGMMKDFYFSGNFSFTESIVTLTAEQEENFTSKDRQLQGLSPLVVNLSFAYEKKNRSATLSYNQMSERIRKVGLIEDGYKEFPDDVEIPPKLLDFVWIEKFENGLNMRFKLANILDDETIWKQGNSVTKRFKKGRAYGVAISYKY
ncbi:MAG: carboxypeptidase-like regulatory domain-containing protein [Campylobacterota bacterium]|nr:carboxypeptidase-like regulatory domain-containing protein [Campylobacterota bacterium]